MNAPAAPATPSGTGAHRCCGGCRGGGRTCRGGGEAWDAGRIPDQTGRLAVVTGATGGLGLETALELARAGAEVVLTGRDADRGRAALGRVRAAVPSARVAFEVLDVADLASVRAFAERFAATHGALDLLVDNAGVMALPTRQTTVDGFERQLGTNYLGHFALTLRLLPLLRAGREARVVTLASLAHRQGRIDLADLQGEARYGAWKAYGQSKLAMLMFAREFQRRSVAGGWGVRAVAAHPGWARTDLVAKGPASGGGLSPLWRLASCLAPLLGQSAARGALPTLFAATAPEALGGGYYGPDGLGEAKSGPAPARVSARGRDAAMAARLWEASERLTGVAAP
jgi:NAD(P)-dependent dehydrogenase (short-subunit alcohol dehydrogenase family)